jgi:hypothetical protein
MAVRAIVETKTNVTRVERRWIYRGVYREPRELLKSAIILWYVLDIALLLALLDPDL